MEQPLVDIGTTIVHGVMFDPKNGVRTQHMDFNHLHSSVAKLFDLLQERSIDYVLVGGVAMLAYVEGRNTQDIDLIIDRDSLQQLPELKIEQENREFARAWLNDLRIDFLFTDNKLFLIVASEHVVQKQFANRVVPCADASGLIALKLFSLPSLFRQGQFEKVEIYENDISALLRRTQLDPEPILQSLTPHMLASDVDELRRIIGRIQERFERESGDFGG